MHVDLRDDQHPGSNLAAIYEHGDGVSVNPAEAYKWYLIAGRSGDAEAKAGAMRVRAGLTPEEQEAPGVDERRSLALLRDLYGAGSDLALVLAQELVGSTERINTPGTVGPQNWTWRLPRPIEELTTDPAIAGRMVAIRALVAASGR